ncbi:MAG: ATP-binding cassette domain-containing protein [Deltaproteobacteria bacterium]|nr:MAG: ATP-binding cassette domain-containing protein [Deltaproteobacteria bacterium]
MRRLLVIKGLKKYFPVTRGLLLAKPTGWIKAVDGVSFSINEGETFGLVGESGCGKTTISKVILLLEKATDGSIYFYGKEPFLLKGKELHDFRSSVQAVFQDPFSSLNPRKRVGAVVAEPLVVNSNLTKNEIQERVEEVLVQVGLNPEAASLFPHEFSGGQRQRIAVARSLIVRPSLIILDEPVSALDVSIQGQIMNLLKDLQAQLGVAYLLIAHNLATVRYMSNRIGMMYLGKLVEQGPKKQVFANRFHPYTKALFSAALPAHPDLVKEEIVLPGEVPSALNPPSGCRFHPRCASAMPICPEVEPESKEVAPNHYVACHLY